MSARSGPLLTRRELRGTILACLGLGLIAFLLSGRLAGEMADLEVYWTAASRAAAGEPLYRAEDGHYQFKYLPAFAVVTAPLGALPWPAAKAAWFTLSAMLLPWLIVLAIALVPRPRKPTWVLAVATTVVMAKFFGHELVLGQVNVLFAVVVLAAVLATRIGREALAGALLALAIVIKPYAVLFLPWLLARRRPASILSAAAGLALVVLLPAAIYGVGGAADLYVAWWQTVTESTAPNLTNNDNVSVAAMYAKWMGIGQAAMVLAVATNAVLLGLVALVVLRRERTPLPEGLEAALLLTCIPLISPQGWDYVFLISTPAVVYLVNYEDRLPRALRAVALASLAIIGLSLFDLMGRAAYSTFMALSIITVCYFVVVGALVVLRVRAVA
ncbi:MAG: DUF2029 domain-containing protein [Acidobacteria bacterium]|nr:DUF2029 domain-containing protein [Acidobacteriota bacterium]